MDRNLEIVGAASLGGLAAWRAKHAAKLGTPCANCGEPLAGPYCHACGQLAEDFERSIGALVMEAFENLFHADGRLVQTVPRLVFRPAALTRDYLAGRRAAQVPPLRLFLVVILVFFFAGGLRDQIEPSHTHFRSVDPAKAFKVDGPEDPRATALVQWLKPRLSYAVTHQREFTIAVENWLHRIAILFLPVATLLLALLFVFQRRFFIFDHAIFSMHSLAFMGLLFTLVTVLNLAPVLRVPAALLGWAAPVHLFFHMRGFYRTSIIGTLARMLVLGLLSSIAFGLLFAGVVALELNDLGAP